MTRRDAVRVAIVVAVMSALTAVGVVYVAMWISEVRW